MQVEKIALAKAEKNKNLQSIWSLCLGEIRKNIPSQSFQTWFKPITPLRIEDDAIIVQVPSQFFYEWLEEHYRDLINRTISEIMGNGSKIEYSVVLDKDDEITPIRPTPYGRFGKRSDDETQLNKKYTFDNFIEGSSNQFAKAASLAVAEAPGKTNFNPLLVYGGVGLGKTHLIQAIGNFAKAEKTAQKILYVSSEKFTIEFISSIQNHKTNEFSSLYRSIDLLLVDDVQFFIDKERTQEEFFHTFNTLHQMGKQIVLSCDRPPGELKGLEERLVSRFQSGLVVDIQPPDLETRMAILQKKAEEEHVSLSPDVALFIASNVTSNIRELEGALIKVLAYSSLTGKTVTIDLAKEVLKDVTRSKAKNISIEYIQKKISEHFEISEDLLRSKTRRKEAVNARMISMYLAKKITNNTLKTIGLLHGGKDHSTVIHALGTIEKQLAADDKLRDTVELLQRKIEYY